MNENDKNESISINIFKRLITVDKYRLLNVPEIILFDIRVINQLAKLR